MTNETCGHISTFIFDNIPVRGALIRLKDLNSHIPALAHKNHGLSAYLSELLTASTTLMTDLKTPADVTLQIHSKSRIPLLVATCTADGNLRAFANILEGTEGPVPFSEISEKEGVFALTVHQHAQNYQSFVKLDEISISSSVEHYFAESVQSPTYFKTFHDKVDEETYCSAIFLQALPHQEETDIIEDHWRRLGLILNTIQNAEILIGDLSDEELLFRLFAEDTLRTFPKKELSFHKPNTRKKMLEALKKIGVQSCKDLLLEEGNIEMVCEFSGKTESFNEKDLKELFGSQWDKE